MESTTECKYFSSLDGWGVLWAFIDFDKNRQKSINNNNFVFFRNVELVGVMARKEGFIHASTKSVMHVYWKMKPHCLTQRVVMDKRERARNRVRKQRELDSKRESMFV